MCTKPFSQTKNKGKLFLVAKSSGPLLARMPLMCLSVTTQIKSFQQQFLRSIGHKKSFSGIFSLFEFGCFGS